MAGRNQANQPQLSRGSERAAYTHRRWRVVLQLLFLLLLVVPLSAQPDLPLLGEGGLADVFGNQGGIKRDRRPGNGLFGRRNGNAGNDDIGALAVGGEEEDDEDTGGGISSSSRPGGLLGGRPNNVNKAPPRSNGFVCMDRPEVEEMGSSCRQIAKNLPGIGCRQLVRDLPLPNDKELPRELPPNARVADICPETCGLCSECADGCALWFLGNGLCDEKCFNVGCQFDGGDCWSRDCTVGEWSDWGECSVSCAGPGTQTRSRKVKEEARNGGAECDDLSEVKSGCNKDVPCPENCRVGEWTEWSECSKTCGDGKQLRNRDVRKPPVGGGEECPPLTDTRKCLSTLCAVDCLTTEWSEWSSCSTTCGGGLRNRKRSVLTEPAYGGENCPILEEEEGCNTEACPEGSDDCTAEDGCKVDCKVSSWGQWSSCTKVCEVGEITRSRAITTKPKNGGAKCPSLKQSRACLVSDDPSCATDCKVSEWSDWSSCSATCDGGTKSRERRVEVEPHSGGKPCPDLKDSEACGTEPCAEPTDCEVSDWTEWGKCNSPERTCGGGVHKRTRKILAPPSDGGRVCPSSLEEMKGCNLSRCPGAKCEDNPDVPEFTGGGTCEILKMQGCEESLKNIAKKFNRPFPSNVPPETRVRDACPKTCGFCEECSPGCELRDLGNTVCEKPCDNEACKFDEGDCRGECKLPEMPVSVKFSPIRMYIDAGDMVTVTCPESSLRFLDFPEETKLELTCQSGGAIDDGGFGLNETNGTLMIPPCVPAAEATPVGALGAGGGADLEPTEPPPPDDEPMTNPPAAGGSKGPSTVFNGTERYCEDAPEVKALSGYDCKELTTKLNLPCAAQLKDVGFKPPPGIPDTATVDKFCPATCGKCEATCADECLDWFLANAHCDPACDNADCKYDEGDCKKGGSGGASGGDGAVSAQGGESTTGPPVEDIDCDILDNLDEIEIPEEYSKLVTGVCEDSPAVTDLGYTCALFKTISKDDCDMTFGELLKTIGSGDTVPTLPPTVPEETKIGDACPVTCELCKKGDTFLPDIVRDKLGCTSTGKPKPTPSKKPGGGCRAEDISEKDIPKEYRSIVTGKCEDSKMVEELGYNCNLFKTIAKEDCTKDFDTLLETVGEGADVPTLPPKVPGTTTVADACPVTCGECTEGEPFLPPIVRKTLGCEDEPSEPSEPKDDEKPTEAPGEAPGDCEDSPLVSSFDITCEVLLVVGTCNDTIYELQKKNKPDATFPSSIPKDTLVKNACPKSCNDCSAVIPLPDDFSLDAADKPPTETAAPCADDPLVNQLGYTCDLLKQFSTDGCRSKLQDMLPEGQRLPDGVPKGWTLEDACPRTCGDCPGAPAPDTADASCQDNPMVESLGYSCARFIEVGGRGCDTLLVDLADGQTPIDLPPTAKVKDTCPKSCGVCGGPSCIDGQQNGKEEGVDCGGNCKPCSKKAGCSIESLKQLGTGVAISRASGGAAVEGPPGRVAHGTRRVLTCLEGYEEVGTGWGYDVVTCLDGKFTAPRLRCEEAKATVYEGRLKIYGAEDFDEVTIPYIHEALRDAMKLQKSEVQLGAVVSSLAAGSDSLPPQGEEVADCGLDNVDIPPEYKKVVTGVCQDSDSVSQVKISGTDITCSLLKQLAEGDCSETLGGLMKLAGSGGPQLPDGVPAETPIFDACPVTCGKCNDGDFYVPSILIENIELPKGCETLTASRRRQRRRMQEGRDGEFLQIVFFLDMPNKKDKDIQAIVSRRVSDQGKFNANFMDDFRFLLKGSSVTLPLGNFTDPPSSAAQLLIDRKATAEIDPPQRRRVSKKMFELAFPGNLSDTSSPSPSPWTILRRPGIGRPKIGMPGTCGGHGGSKSEGDDGFIPECCELLESLLRFLDGECGALLYRGEMSSARAKAFCEGSPGSQGQNRGSDSCHESFNQILEESHKFRDSCPAWEPLKTMADSWCAKAPDHHHKDGKRAAYCFGDILSDQRDMGFKGLASRNTKRLDQICASHSCFRSNVRYMTAVRQLAEMGGEAADGEAATEIEQLRGPVPAELQEAFAREQNGGRLPYYGPFREELLDVMCVRVGNEYCQTTALLVADDNPIDNPDIVLNPCSSRCLMPVVSRMGTALTRLGLDRHSPFHRQLGQLLVAFSRFACSRTTEGSSCRGYLFSPGTSGRKDGSALLAPPSVDAFDLAACRSPCPASYVGDGQCDAACYSEPCMYDGGDCLFQSMFPHVADNLLGGISTPECLPYEEDFNCPKNTCRLQLIDGLDKRGCCVAAAMEILRAALQGDVEQTTLFDAANVPVWQVDRSVPFVEQKCGLSLDRTCSAGQSFQVKKTDLFIENLDHEALAKNKAALGSLEMLVQDVLAGKLGTVPTDINRIVFRPNMTTPSSTNAEVYFQVPTGDANSFITKRLEQQLRSGSATAALTAALQQLSSLESLMSDPKRPLRAGVEPQRTHDTLLRSATVNPLPLSLAKAPAIPPAGTLGLKDLGMTLPLEACSEEEVDKAAKSLKIDSLKSSVRAFKHTEESSVSCADGYSATRGKQPDTLLCDNGKLIVKNGLLCRQMCSGESPELPFNATTPPRAPFLAPNEAGNVSTEGTVREGGGYRAVGEGYIHGSSREVSCLKGYTAIEGKAPETIGCVDGQWQELRLDCRADCTELSLGDGYRVEGSGLTHGDTRKIKCSPGYFSTKLVAASTHTLSVTVTCQDGSWAPPQPIKCVKPDTTTKTPRQGFFVFLRDLFSGNAAVGIVVLIVFCVVMVIASLLAWKYYFKDKSIRNHEEREKRIQQRHGTTPVTRDGTNNPSADLRAAGSKTKAPHNAEDDSLTHASGGPETDLLSSEGRENNSDTSSLGPSSVRMDEGSRSTLPNTRGASSNNKAGPDRHVPWAPPRTATEGGATLTDTDDDLTSAAHFARERRRHSWGQDGTSSVGSEWTESSSLADRHRPRRPPV